MFRVIMFAATTTFVIFVGMAFTTAALVPGFVTMTVAVPIAILHNRQRQDGGLAGQPRQRKPVRLFQTYSASAAVAAAVP